MVVVGYDGIEFGRRSCSRPLRAVPCAATRGWSCAASARFDIPIDTLIISGGQGNEDAAANPRFVGQMQRLAGLSHRVASVCTGATVLAAAGLLDGRRATTHWGAARRLAQRYPRVHVNAAPVYIRDGHVATSGGVTASLDLTLAFIEEDHGGEIARQVALGMVTYLQRPGNQAQMSIFTTTPRPEQRIVRRTIDHITSNLDADLRTAALADVAGVSERHLSRLFDDQLGRTPAQVVRDARLEAASRLLTTARESLPTVARRCGFRSAEALRQAFVARFGLPPSRFREVHITKHDGHLATSSAAR